MYADTKHARDPFTFSLRGVAGVNSHAFVPAVALDGINRAFRARRLDRRLASGQPRVPSAVHHVERVLARYFAHGCCHAA